MEVQVKEKSMQEIIDGLPQEVREELDLFERQIKDYQDGMPGVSLPTA